MNIERVRTGAEGVVQSPVGDGCPGERVGDAVDLDGLYANGRRAAQGDIISVCAEVVSAVAGDGKAGCDRRQLGLNETAPARDPGKRACRRAGRDAGRCKAVVFGVHHR